MHQRTFCVFSTKCSKLNYVRAEHENRLRHQVAWVESNWLDHRSTIGKKAGVNNIRCGNRDHSKTCVEHILHSANELSDESLSKAASPPNKSPADPMILKFSSNEKTVDLTMLVGGPLEHPCADVSPS